MKSFNFKRFLNVARWDLSVNSKFYTRAAILIVALTCSPVLLYYLHMLASGTLLNGGMLYDNVITLGTITATIGCAIIVISSGYMFHNLLTKQGRINELTLPATNLERFLWHFVVIVVGVQVIWIGGVVLADLIHALFRLAIPDAEIHSLTASTLDGYSNWGSLGKDIYVLGGILIAQLCTCGARSFALFNAWKYKYNIPWTLLFYFVFQNAFALLVLFIGHCMSPALMMKLWNWVGCVPRTVFFVSLNLFAVLLYAGVWYLTYRLYCRAQITTRRNP